jgi:transcription elongation factor Elf1
MSFIEDKFIGMISPRLDKFKKIKSGLYNFRCPICGDSKKNKNRARGYLYQKKSDVNYKCHNCGATTSFGYFLKSLDEVIYQEYLLERYKEGLTGKGTVVPNPEPTRKAPKFTYSIFKDLPKISDLNNSHPAKQYLIKRKIPEQYYSKFYYAEDFNVWSKSNNKYRESRIVIPLKTSEGHVFGYQGRSLDPNTNLRYITTILDTEYPKIFGLDHINKEETIYVTEGPFDSTFISNAIALCGADGNLSEWGINNPVWIYDNEPRNREIVSRVSRAIEMGQKVVIWPSSIKEKDINDMVLSGHNVQSLVTSNTYTGLEAQLKFNEWKKV